MKDIEQYSYEVYYGNPDESWNKTDLHTHTNIGFDDGKLSPERIVEDALQKGFRAVVIGGHDAVRAGIIGKNYAIQRDLEADIQVIPGTEISTADGHLLAIGVEYDIAKGKSAEETLLRIHELQGLGISVHPNFLRAQGFAFSTIDRLLESPDPKVSLDGFEMYNVYGEAAHTMSLVGNIFPTDTNKEAKDYYDKNRGHPKIGAAVGGSDEHCGKLGLGITFFEGDDLLKAIRQRKTAVGYASDDKLTIVDFFKPIIISLTRPLIRKYILKY